MRLSGNIGAKGEEQRAERVYGVASPSVQDWLGCASNKMSYHVVSLSAKFPFCQAEGAIVTGNTDRKLMARYLVAKATQPNGTGHPGLTVQF